MQGHGGRLGVRQRLELNINPKLPAVIEREPHLRIFFSASE